MKMNPSFESSFLFDPRSSLAGTWPAPRRSKVRRVSPPLSLALETQIDYKQEFICGAILLLCLLFALAAFVAQFALA